jgi:hypothetical protein
MVANLDCPNSASRLCRLAQVWENPAHSGAIGLKRVAHENRRYGTGLVSQVDVLWFDRA